MPTFFLNLLNNYENKAIIYKYHKFALVAQLDRVFGYEPKGRGFESLQPYQNEGHVNVLRVVLSSIFFSKNNAQDILTEVCALFLFFLSLTPASEPAPDRSLPHRPTDAPDHRTCGPHR